MKPATFFVFFCFLLLLGSCKKDPAFTPQLSVNITSVQLLSEGGSSELQVTANTSWKITIPEAAASWLSADQTSGEGNATIVVTAAANAAEGTRRAVFTLEETGAGEATPLTITVEQGAFVPVLSASQTSWLIAAEGASEKVSLTANIEWKLTLPAGVDWLQADRQTGVGGGELTFTVKPYTGLLTRKAEVQLEAVQYSVVASVVLTFEQQPPASSTITYEKGWQKTLPSGGSSLGTAGRALARTADGGYIAASIVSTNNDINRDLMLVKLRENGEVQWSHKYGLTTVGEIRSVVVSADGYAVAGHTRTNANDTWVFKTDLQGAQKWSFTLGDAAPDRAYDMVAVGDGYVVTGQVDDAASSSNVLLLKLDNDGTLQWRQSFTKTGATPQYGYALVTEGNGFVIAATDVNTDAFRTDLWLLKVSATGVLEWDQTFRGQGYRPAFYLAALPDGYVISGVRSGDIGINLLKTDKSGNKVWESTYGPTSYSASSLAATPDGGFVLTGGTRSGSTVSLLVARLDKNGHQQWEEIYAHPAGGNQQGNSVVVAGDGFTVLGSKNSTYGSEAYEPWIIRYNIK